MSSLGNNTLPLSLRDTLYRTISDSWPLGEFSQTKGDPVRGYCSLCYWLRGKEILENTDHRFKDCPYTAQILTHAWRTFTECVAIAHDSDTLKNTAGTKNDERILYYYGLPLVTGALLLKHEEETHRLHEPFQILIALIQPAVQTRAVWNKQNEQWLLLRVNVHPMTN